MGELMLKMVGYGSKEVARFEEVMCSFNPTPSYFLRGRYQRKEKHKVKDYKKNKFYE